MKSSIRLSSIAAIALSAAALSSAFAATYVPHENNYGLYDGVTRGTVSTQATPTDTRMPKTTDTMQTAASKKAALADNSRAFRREDGSAK